MGRSFLSICIDLLIACGLSRFLIERLSIQKGFFILIHRQGILDILSSLESRFNCDTAVVSWTLHILIVVAQILSVLRTAEIDTVTFKVSQILQEVLHHLLFSND